MLKSLKDENMVKVYITNVDDFIHYKDNSPHNDFLHLITQVLVSGIRQKDGILEHLTAANGSDDDKGETPIVWDQLPKEILSY